ncbi:hypothetical protein [Nonomuraea sp. NPDC049480]|uniref:hypothetical protein n=1 Tax=Nonomuraea sp. NPDC049480 TaxID=3364353 RepID=UPI003797CA79
MGQVYTTPPRDEPLIKVLVGMTVPGALDAAEARLTGLTARAAARLGTLADDVLCGR